MDKHHIYCISGLGLDKRVFSALQLNGSNVHYLEWLEPKKRESIEDYARRMLQQIKQEGNIVLIGYSFGGVMAIEIAKLKRVKQIIQISSVKMRREIPLVIRLAQYIPLYRLTSSVKQRHRSRKWWGKYFGLFTPKDLDFFESMLDTTSTALKFWSVAKLASWRNHEFPENIVQINGTKDRLFPHSCIQNTHLIEGGTHFMIVNQAEEVYKKLSETLNNL